MRAPRVVVVAAMLLAFGACAPEVCEQNRVRLLRAQRSLAAHRYVAAIADYEAAYRAEPRPSLLLDIGLAYDMLADRANAIAYYARYLEADVPDKETVRAHLANLHRETLSKDEAAADDKLRYVLEARAEQLPGTDCP